MKTIDLLRDEKSHPEQMEALMAKIEKLSTFIPTSELMLTISGYAISIALMSGANMSEMEKIIDMCDSSPEMKMVIHMAFNLGVSVGKEESDESAT